MVQDTVYEDKALKFGNDYWNRLTSEDCLGYAGYNSRWDSRSKKWVMPLNYVYGPMETSKPEGIYDEYKVMLYYSLINLGISEFGP